MRKLIKKLGAMENLRVCHEAGAISYVLYWQLVEMGVLSEVIAPSLVPVKATGEDRSARRRETGAKLSIRRSDCGLAPTPKPLELRATPPLIRGIQFGDILRHGGKAMWANRVD